MALAAEYRDENCGIQLREVAGGWRFLHASRLQRRHRALRHLMGHASHIAGPLSRPLPSSRITSP